MQNINIKMTKVHNKITKIKMTTGNIEIKTVKFTMTVVLNWFIQPT